MPLADQPKPLPTTLRRGAYPDTIEFDLPDGTKGWGSIESRPVGMGGAVANEIVARYNQHQPKKEKTMTTCRWIALTVVAAAVAVTAAYCTPAHAEPYRCTSLTYRCSDSDILHDQRKADRRLADEREWRESQREERRQTDRLIDRMYRDSERYQDRRERELWR